MFIYEENPVRSTKKSSRAYTLVLARLRKTRSLYEKQLYFYMLAMKSWKLTLKKIPSMIASKNIEYLLINLTQFV